MNAGLQDCNVCNLGAQIDGNLVHPNTVASLLSRTPKGPLGHAFGIHSGTHFGIHSGPIWDCRIVMIAGMEDGNDCRIAMVAGWGQPAYSESTPAE